MDGDCEAGRLLQEEGGRDSTGKFFFEDVRRGPAGPDSSLFALRIE